MAPFLSNGVYLSVFVKAVRVAYPQIFLNVDNFVDKL